MLITCLLLVQEVWDGKPTYRKSCAGNLLLRSALTLGTSLKVNGSLALVSCLSGGYKFASVLRCVGLVLFDSNRHVFLYISCMHESCISLQTIAV